MSPTHPPRGTPCRRPDPRITVLLVDDHDAFRRVATLFLQRQGDLAVVGAMGKVEALTQARALQPEVILIDPHTTSPAGLEVIPRLRSILPQSSIIVLSLEDSSVYWQAALSAGADECVCKANLVSDLLPCIRQLTQADRRPDKAIKEDSP